MHFCRARPHDHACSLCSQSCVLCAATLHAMFGIAALREENELLMVQNSLIKLFLGLPHASNEDTTDESQSDAGGRAVSADARSTTRKPKRRRPPRKPTCKRPDCYEMDPKNAFQKYGISLPETARESLLLMTCVPERDFRRATRMHLMKLLFPSRIGTTEALTILDAFLREHHGTSHVAILRMSLFKHFESLPAGDPAQV